MLCAVWAILYALTLVQPRNLFEPTLATCLTAVPVLWATGRASVRRSTAWGIATATLVSFVLPVVLLFVFMVITARPPSPCILPSLESSIATRTVREVPTTGFLTHTCPTPIPRELEFNRDYGTLEMRLWGAPHRLHISGRTPDDDPLRVGVERLDPTGRTWVSPHPRASKVVTFFQTYNLDPSEVRLGDHTEEFSVTVFRPDGTLLEEIPLRYVPHTCSCVYFDGP